MNLNIRDEKIKTYKIPSSYLKDKYENNKNTETINKKDVMDAYSSARNSQMII